MLEFSASLLRHRLNFPRKLHYLLPTGFPKKLSKTEGMYEWNPVVWPLAHDPKVFAHMSLKDFSGSSTAGSVPVGQD